MADYEEEIPDEEKVKIASDFILNAPPGEFNEVFNDVRVLLANDALLKDGAAKAFQQYNEQQFTPAKLDGVKDEVLITPYGRQANGKYLDPASKNTFSFDHLRKVTGDIEPADVDESLEDVRASFEKEARAYTLDHYPSGVSSVFAKGKSIIVCIEDHKFQPNNFWNGRWRSEWTLDTDSGKASGSLKVQVHYYEDGNVQLQSLKEIALDFKEVDAKAFFKKVATAENDYQTAISENYNEMSDTTFKALRRALPITRTKLDWNKILNYKIGKELSSK